MAFRSILFDEPDGAIEPSVKAPDFFRDLNLDQIVDGITANRQEYDLKPFFHTPLTRPDTIAYRQEIMRDLEDAVRFGVFASFSSRMRTMRQHRAAIAKLHCTHHKEGWFLEAASVYCEAIESLRDELAKLTLNARGLQAFRDYLTQYAGSDAFRTLLTQVRHLKSRLSGIRYSLRIKDHCVTVSHYGTGIDYSAAIEEVFARFKQGAVKDYRVKLPESSYMNHVKARVLESVALLNPEIFAALSSFCVEHKDFVEGTIAVFDREIQFYLAYLEYLGSFKRAGLEFCYPRVSDACKEVFVRESFDLALAGQLIRENAAVVRNDFRLEGQERILVVTGPNQGGKTTFARMFGQLHYLACLGGPVPGTEARLYRFEGLFTHFERAESVGTLRGKLQDDLTRIHGILRQASPRSIVIMNEIFSSTTLQDAAYLGKKVLDRISQLDALCVCVTFLDELSSLNEKTVSVVASVDPDDPTMRTYRIERKPADGLAYALAIAERYRLTYACLKERMKL